LYAKYTISRIAKKIIPVVISFSLNESLRSLDKDWEPGSNSGAILEGNRFEAMKAMLK